VGTPSQQVFVLPSTLISENLVVGPAGCDSTSDSNCQSERGDTFSNSTSTTWEELVYNQVLSVDTSYGIGSSDGVDFGYDTVGLTSVEGAGIVLDHQIVGMYDSMDFFVGILGLSADTSSISSNGQTSFLRTLFDKEQIPSLSYSYTAGAYYSKRHRTWLELTMLTKARAIDPRPHSRRAG
jgi:hypothetical protein